MKYVASVRLSFKCILYKMSLVQSAITTGPLMPRSLSGPWREIEESSSFKTQSSISPFLYLSVCFRLYLPLCLILSLSPSLCALPGPAEARDSHVDLGASSQAASQGNYPELAGHLMRFTMIYVALCTENRIRDPHIGLLLINSTLLF